MGDNGIYYQRRLREELAAAERAECVRAAAAHRELAEIYSVLLEAEESRPERRHPEARGQALISDGCRGP